MAKADAGNIRILVPYDCRRKFPTMTDRNFIYVVPIDYDIGTMGNKILEVVAKEFRGNPEKMLCYRDNCKIYFASVISLFAKLANSLKFNELA